MFLNKYKFLILFQTKKNHAFIVETIERPKRDSICNVPLPAPQPMASHDAMVAKRLFIVLQSVNI